MNIIWVIVLSELYQEDQYTEVELFSSENAAERYMKSKYKAWHEAMEFEKTESEESSTRLYARNIDTGDHIELLLQKKIVDSQIK